MTLNISCQSLLACKVSFEKSADSFMGTLLGLCLPLSGKKLCPSSCLDAKHLFFPVWHWCLSSCYFQFRSSEGVSLGTSVYGFFKRNWLGLQKVLVLTQSLLGYAARSYGHLSSWHCNPGLGELMWCWDFSEISPSNFYLPCVTWDKPFLCLRPDYRSGCMWFL